MSREQDPPRLFLSEDGADRELRLALGTARSDLPSSARLEAILAGLPLEPGPPDGGGGEGGSGGEPSALGEEPDAGDIGAGGVPDVTSVAPAAAAAGAGFGKLAGVLALGAALAGVTYVATRPPDPPPAPSTNNAVISSADATVASSAPVAPAAEPTPSASAAASASHAAPVVPPPSASAPVRPEIDILKEARDSLGSNPGRTLLLADEHARSHPKGMLGQEREMLRIQALVGLGRSDQARALAKAFKERHPNSAYVHRLDAMFP